MSIQVVHHNSKTESNKHTIIGNLDDNINLLTKKIAYLLGKDPSKIYLWTIHKIVKSPAVMLNFVHNIFKGEKLIDATAFNRMCEGYFGMPLLEKGDFKMIDKALAYKIIDDANISQVIQPLSHYFSDGGHTLYVQYNPLKFNNTPEQASDIAMAMTRTNANTTLNTVAGADVSKIYVIDSSYFLDKDTLALDMYFPFRASAGADMKLYQKQIKQFVEYITPLEKELQNELTKEQVNTQVFLNILQLDTKDVFVGHESKYNLGLLFNALAVSSSIPFIKYKARTNIYHKVDKTFLKTMGDAKEFEKWYSTGNFKLQETTYIMFKIHYRNDKYIALIVKDNLQCDVRLNFHVKDEEKLATVNKLFPSVNTIFDRIRKLYVNSLLPDLPKHVEDISDAFTIKRFVTYHVSNLGTKASKTYAEGFVKNKMFPFFEVVPDKSTNVLRLQYKKVDDFGKAENIDFFIAKNRKLPTDELIKKIQDQFTISAEDAETELDRWEFQKKGDDNADFQRFDQYVEVKMRFNSPVDVRYVVHGCNSVGMVNRIAKLVDFLLVHSTAKATEAKKDAEAKKIFEATIDVKDKTNDVGETNVQIDETEDDADWMAELAALDEEFGGDDDKEAVSSDKKHATAHNTSSSTKLLALEDDDDSGKKLKGFVKRMLDSADRDLFSYKSESGKRRDFASLCGWVDRRQPVVITEEEKKLIDEKYPGAYNGFVKSGSTEDLERKHFYICPKVWCPKGRVAISPALYKQKGKDACPDKEEPIVFESKSYWGLGDESLNREHYPGFLDKHTRADGLCLPCCFKLEPKQGNRNKQRQSLCVPKSQHNPASDEAAVADEAVGTEKYIKSDSYFPLEISRYGLLPKDLHGFLGKDVCGQRYNGTGLMKEHTDCYLRKGIFHGAQSFIQCIIHSLENKKITSYKDFIGIVNTRLDVAQFLTLENGRIVQIFIDHSKKIEGDDYTEFRAWFLKNESYISKFNLLKIKHEMEQHSVFSKNMRFYKDVIREFIIYFAFKNFIAYLNDNEIEKDHRILLDLVNIATEWLNVNEYNFVVLDVETSTGKVYIDCALNRDTKEFVNKKTPFVFLVKQNKYYEPLVHVKTAPNVDIYNNFKFIRGDPKHKRIFDIITFYFNNCSSIKKSSDQMKLPLYLESVGYKPKYYVIDYNFRLCGLLLINNLYIPFQTKKDMYALKGLKFVYISDIVLFKCLEDKKAIRDVFKKLVSEYGVFYEIDTWITDKDVLNGVVLKGGVFVPLNAKSNSTTFKGYLDDLYIFTSEKEADDRITFMDNIIAKKAYINELLKKVEEKMTDDDRMEIMFIKDQTNPLPRDFRRKKLMDIMFKYIPKVISWDYGQQMAEKMFNQFYESRQTVIKRFVVKENEILFDFNDIQEGKVIELIENAKNPYKLFHNKLDELFDTYVFNNGEEPNEEKQAFESYITASSEFTEVPAKYGSVQYRKLLKGFSVLDKNIDLYDLFEASSKVTSSGQSLQKKVVMSVIKTNIVKDFPSNAIEQFTNNPSFQAHLKVDKIKVPSLDDVLRIFESMHYTPGFYELMIMARVANVNVILIGRQTLKNPEGLFEVVFTKSPFYIFMIQSFDRERKCNAYSIIVKNKKDILLSKKDLPTEIIEMVNARLSSS